MADAVPFAPAARGLPSSTFRVHVRLGALEPRHSFGLHIWGPAASSATAWDAPQLADGEDWFGPYFDIALALNTAAATLSVSEAPALGVLLHCGEDKRSSHEFSAVADVPAAGSEFWLGLAKPLTEQPKASDVPCGDLATGGARAHWLTKEFVAWRAAGSAPSESTFALYSSFSAALEDGGADGVRNVEGICPLFLKARELTPELAEAHPFLKGCALLEVPSGLDFHKLVRCQLAVAAVSKNGECLDCTGVQIGGVLDDLYTYAGPLGCAPPVATGIIAGLGRLFGSFLHTAPPPQTEVDVSLTLWAPTAQEVSVCIFEKAQGKGELDELLPMAFDEGSGVWSIRGPSSWWGRFYTYRIKAYHPQVRRVVEMETPDPYCHACSADSARSLVQHLPSWEEVAPSGSIAAWRSRSPPAFQDRGAASIYELHIRDFSMSDEAVPEDKRGKYVAFELQGTNGDKHLRRLAAAGLTHVQLLPNYDFGSVPERAENRKEPAVPAGEAPDSELPQKLLTEVQDLDSFNWGYDPVLYNVPEGSYATDPDGGARILEHRRMIQALHDKGLRVVVDVVYNHTHGSGPEGPHSVLDKCVPGYYHRRCESGAYENSTCMNNTAAERTMMERFVVDSVMHWVKEYRVDGFRFDLMGHLPLKCVMALRTALDNLTVASDGIDGLNVLMYGEGWEFGEIANDQRGPVAVQRRLASSGVGSFNDRLRDAALGGTPFIDPRVQGFCTGLFLRPWPKDAEVDQGDEEKQREDLLVAADKIRVALTASLKDYCFPADCEGNEGVLGCSIHGGGVGYTGQPQEIINYVSAHDNETLFDNTAWKMSPTLFSPEERMRANWLLTSIVALSHGIPFFHAGDELLRSKSLDRDSYNSGDWFNVLDFTGKRNAFGTGLPVKGKNGEKWDLMRPLLKDATVKPTAALAAASTAKFCELLKIRRSTPLLGLTDAQDILTKVDFPGSGKDQIPGIIVMQVRNGPWSRATTSPNACDKFARIVVVFSARLEETRIPVPTAFTPSVSQDVSTVQLAPMGVMPLELHPVQAASEDVVVRSAKVDVQELVIPPLTAAVFVEPFSQAA